MKILVASNGKFPAEIGKFCPAEEVGLGKIALQEAGIFDDLDIILTPHGDYQNASLSRPCYAVASGEFIFRGDSAHAGMGTLRIALKAAEEAMAASVSSGICSSKA